MALVPPEIAARRTAYPHDPGVGLNSLIQGNTPAVQTEHVFLGRIGLLDGPAATRRSISTALSHSSGCAVRSRTQDWGDWKGQKVHADFASRRCG